MLPNHCVTMTALMMMVGISVLEAQTSTPISTTNTNMVGLALAAVPCRAAQQEPSAMESSFEVSVKPREVPPYFWGVNTPMLFAMGRMGQSPTWWKNDPLLELVRDMHYQHVRGPDGTPANYYLWRDGGGMDPQDPRFLHYYTKEKMEMAGMVTRKPGWTGLFLKDVYWLSEQLHIPCVFALNVSSQDVPELKAEVQQIRTLTQQPINLELGNELYAMDNSVAFPTVRDYVAKAQQISQAVHQIDSKIKIGIVAVSPEMEDRVLKTPSNATLQDRRVDWESTQAGRIMVWNKTLADHPEIYDAVIVHVYATVPNVEHLTADGLMQYLFAYNEASRDGVLRLGKMCPGKEFWITEWGILPAVMLREKDPVRKGQLQFMKTPGVAVTYIDRALQMLDTGLVTLNTSCGVIDPQGFGMVQYQQTGGPHGTKELVKLPNYYVFKALGELLAENRTYYPIRLQHGGTRAVPLRFTTGVTVELADTAAWGFGDAQGMRKVVLINRTDQPVTVDLSGWQLRPVWQYGGANPIPEFLTRTGLWTDAPKDVPLPVCAMVDDSPTITLPPYSMTIAQVKPVGTPVSHVTE